MEKFRGNNLLVGITHHAFLISDAALVGHKEPYINMTSRGKDKQVSLSRSFSLLPFRPICIVSSSFHSFLMSSYLLVLPIRLDRASLLAALSRTSSIMKSPESHQPTCAKAAQDIITEVPRRVGATILMARASAFRFRTSSQKGRTVPEA